MHELYRIWHLHIEKFSCNVPDPPTGEEDATVPLTIRATSPMNMYIHINWRRMLGSKKNAEMHNYLTYSGRKTIHPSIQHVHHNSLNIKYYCRSKLEKNTYLIKNSSCNQLRHCNVPPNHRLACSLISQQCCHPRARNDSPRNKEQEGLHIAKDTQNTDKPT